MAFLAGALAVLVLAGACVGVAAWTVRRRFRRLPGAFSCRVRRGRSARLRWHRTRARWLHDVLVLQSGPLRLWLTPLALQIAPRAVVHPVTDAAVRGLGERPWALLFRGDDGLSVEVAVAAKDRTTLVGPYLTAALKGLPSARQEPGS